MLRIHGEATGKYCDGLSRRSFVQIGLAGMASMSLPQLLQAREAAAKDVTAKDKSGKKISMILIWIDGGPSHMDTYDMKPLAPVEYRGIWNPIKTNVPGMQVTELFPLQAKIADKFAVLRSCHHESGDHFTGGHIMLTGRNAGVSGANTTGKFPCFGSIIGKVCGPRKPGMPAYAAVPHASSIGLRPGYFGANYLGSQYNPFETEGDPNAAKFNVRNLSLSGGLTIERLADRRHLNEQLDAMRRQADRLPNAQAMNKFDSAALDLVTSPTARAAFDIDSEDPKLRETYGRHSWGQSALLARRLVEAGCTFVTVHLGGWDHHWDLQKGMDNYLPKVDSLVSGLLNDLHNRGLLDTTLVAMFGEFGRTPRMNDGGNGGPAGSKGTPGRDHWGGAMSILLAGAGVKPGRMVGSTNRLGEMPQDMPVSAGDLHTTIYKLMGVNPEMTFNDLAGRPIPAVDKGRFIHELF